MGLNRFGQGLTRRCTIFYLSRIVPSLVRQHAGQPAVIRLVIVKIGLKCFVISFLAYLLS